MGGVFQLLADLLGKDIPFRNIAFVHARNVKDVLMCLPKNRNKVKETRGLPVREQISIEGVERLSVTSVNRYLQCYNGLFSWAVKNGYIDKNPFEGMALKSATGERHDQFTLDQIQLMLAIYAARHFASLAGAFPVLRNSLNKTLTNRYRLTTLDDGMSR